MDRLGKQPRIILKGHTDRVNSIVFSPDGRQLVSASRDGTVKVWDPAVRPSPGGLQVIAGASGPVAFSADGRVLIVPDRDRRIQLLDPRTGQLVGQLGQHPWDIRQMAVAPAGSMVAVAGERAIRVWDLVAMKAVSTITDLQVPVHCLSFSVDGKVFASGGADRRVRFWDPVSGKEIRPPLPDQGAAVLRLAFAPDGRTLALATAAKVVKLWDLAQGKARSAQPVPEAVTDLAFAPDGRTFAVIGAFGTWFFDAVDGNRCGTMGAGRYLAYAPDGKSIFTTSLSDGYIDQYHPTTKSHKYGFRIGFGSIAGLAAARDGRTLAVSSGGVVKILDTAKLHLTAPQEQLPHPVHRLAFSADSRLLLTAGRAPNLVADPPPVALRLGGFTIGSYKAQRTITRNVQETVCLWDVHSHLPLPSALLDKTIHAVSPACLSPDGHILAGGTCYGMVGLWDLATGGRKGTLRLGDDAEMRAEQEKWILSRGKFGDIRPNAWRILDLAFSRDGRFLAASCEAGQVKVFDPASGRELARLEGGPGPVPCLAFSPDSRLLATACGDQVRLWQAGTNRLVRTLLGHHDPVHALAFSPDGRLLATGSQDCRIRLWETDTEKNPVILPGHLDPVTALAFSPDGRTLASASWDRTVRLWYLRTGQELLRLEGHSGKVYAVTFSADGTTLASGGESADGKGEVFLWRAEPAQARAQLP